MAPGGYGDVGLGRITSITKDDRGLPFGIPLCKKVVDRTQNNGKLNSPKWLHHGQGKLTRNDGWPGGSC